MTSHDLCQGGSFQSVPSTNHQEKDTKPTSVNTTLLHKTSKLTTSNPTSQHKPNKVCFLKTAVAMVRVINYQTQTNVLLNEDAQRSFISQALANQLKITTFDKKHVAISAFEASESSNQTLPVATTFLRPTKGGKIPISILVIPRISQPIHNLPFSYVPYLKGTPLTHAVPDNQEFEISMLIGADSYWPVVQKTVIPGPGPTALSQN